MLRAFYARKGSTNPRPSELVALGLAESRQSYVRGVALSREPPKLQQAQPLLAAWDRDRALLPSCDLLLFFIFSSHTSTFQLLDKPWSQVSSLLPPDSCLQVLSRIGFSAIPLLVDFSSSVANTRSRAFRKSIRAQEKVPTNLYEYALGGARTHETDHTRLEDNLIRHRGDR